MLNWNVWNETVVRTVWIKWIGWKSNFLTNCVPMLNWIFLKYNWLFA